MMNTNIGEKEDETWEWGLGAQHPQHLPHAATRSRTAGQRQEDRLLGTCRQ